MNEIQETEKQGKSDQERVVMCPDKRLTEILNKGGSIIMHKNDIERLKEAKKAGCSLSVFHGVKAYPDQLGLVSEGEPLAVIIDEDGVTFDFRSSLNT